MKSSPPACGSPGDYVKATSTIVQTAKNIMMTKKKHPTRRIRHYARAMLRVSLSAEPEVSGLYIKKGRDHGNLAD